MAKYVTPVLVLVVAVLAVALFVRGGEVLTALAISTTNVSASTTNITNTAPTCQVATCYDADGSGDIDLVGGDTRFVYCRAVCNDNNGWGNIINYTGTIGTSGSDCTPATYLSCYQNATCQNTSYVNATAMNVQCSYNFWFHADNTSQTGDWTGGIKAGDVPGLESAQTTDTIDVQALLALGVNSVLSFGAKSAAVNDTDTTHSHTIYNYGNIQMDFQVNGSAMTCGVGTIPAEYLKAGLLATTDYPAAYALTATLSGPNSTKFDDFNLAEGTTTTGSPVVASSSPSYWGIGIPSGVSGNCQGSIWFAAVAS